MDPITISQLARIRQQEILFGVTKSERWIEQPLSATLPSRVRQLLSRARATNTRRSDAAAHGPRRLAIKHE